MISIRKDAGAVIIFNEALKSPIERLAPSYALGLAHKIMTHLAKLHSREITAQVWHEVVGTQPLECPIDVVDGPLLQQIGLRWPDGSIRLGFYYAPAEAIALQLVDRARECLGGEPVAVAIWKRIMFASQVS